MKQTRKLKDIKPGETFEWVKFSTKDLERAFVKSVLDDMEITLTGNIWIIEATVDVNLTIGRIVEEVRDEKV